MPENRDEFGRTRPRISERERRWGSPEDSHYQPPTRKRFRDEETNDDRPFERRPIFHHRRREPRDSHVPPFKYARSSHPDDRELSWKEFVNTLPRHIPYQDHPRMYDEYKRQFQMNFMKNNEELHSRQIFDKHKNKEWFIEQFDPVYIEEKWQEKIPAIQAKNKDILNLFQNHETNLDDIPNFTLNASLYDLSDFVTFDKFKVEEPKFKEEEDTFKEKEDTFKEEEDTFKVEEENEKDETEEKEEKDQDQKQGEKEEKKQTSQFHENRKLLLPNETILFIRHIPPSLTRKKLISLFEKVAGYITLSLSDPSGTRDYNRFGWVFYETPEKAEQALSELNNHLFELEDDKEFHLQLAHNQPKKKDHNVSLVRIAPPISTRYDFARLTELIRFYKNLYQIDDKDTPFAKYLDYNLENEDDCDAIDHLSETLFDQMVYYLRNVFSVCYFCAEEYENPTILRQHCLSHLHLSSEDNSVSRVPNLSIDPARGEKSEHFNLLQILLKRHREPSKIVDETVFNTRFKNEILSKNMKKIAEEKFRCTYMNCDKLFRAEHFVEKHIKLKHPEDISILRRELEKEKMWENYRSDPKRKQIEMPVSSLYLQKQQEFRKTPQHLGGIGGGGLPPLGGQTKPPFQTFSKPGSPNKRRRGFEVFTPKDYVDYDKPTQEAQDEDMDWDIWNK